MDVSNIDMLISDVMPIRLDKYFVDSHLKKLINGLLILDS